MDAIVMQDCRENSGVRAVLEDISWERIIMKFVVRVYGDVKDLNFYLVAEFLKANAEFKIDDMEKLEDGARYHLSLNITNPGYRICMPLSMHKLMVCSEDKVLCEPEVSTDLIPQLGDKSRQFPFSNNTRSYNINLFIAEDDDDLHLCIQTIALRRQGIREFHTELDPEVFKTTDEPNYPWYKQLAYKVLDTKEVLRKIYFHFVKKEMHHEKPVVMFYSEQNDTIKGNLIAVYDKMMERGLDKDFEFIFSAYPLVQKGGRPMKAWFKLMRELARADFVFTDDHDPTLNWLELEPKTKIIQLWHAGAGYKSSGYSRWGHKGCPAPFSAHRQYSYGIAGSKHIAHFFSEVFGINTEQILPLGMPRMDEYIDENHRKKVEAELRKKYPMINGKKVVLFAPTYRGKNRSDADYPYEQMDLDRFYDLCGDEWVVLFKMHPWTNRKVPLEERHKDRMIDVGAGTNINDMFYITDLLITDYSSCVFEYSLMKKPMMFYAFDMVQYSFSRGFHRDYKSSTPGKVCETFDELMEAFEKKDFEYEKVAPYIEEHFDYVDTHASDRVIDWILLGQMPEDIKASLDAIERNNEKLIAMDFSKLKDKN